LGWQNHHHVGESRVGGYLCLNPQKLSIKDRIEEARTALLTCASPWEQYQTNNVVRDPGFVRSEPLNQFLHRPDQEQALTKMLLGVVSDLRNFRAKFSFSWEQSVTEVEDKE
jgi:hypothetical protein